MSFSLIVVTEERIFLRVFKIVSKSILGRRRETKFYSENVYFIMVFMWNKISVNKCQFE